MYAIVIAYPKNIAGKKKDSHFFYDFNMVRNHKKTQTRHYYVSSTRLFSFLFQLSEIIHYIIDSDFWPSIINSSHVISSYTCVILQVVIYHYFCYRVPYILILDTFCSYEALTGALLQLYLPVFYRKNYSSRRKLGCLASNLFL